MSGNYYNNSTNTDTVPIIKVGEVISVLDTTKSGRIKVRITGVDDLETDSTLIDCVPLLPKYLSTLPKGTNLESVYESLKSDPHQTWTIPDFEIDEVKSELSKSENREFKEILDSIIRINVDTGEETADNHLFEIMERKYRVSLEISSIIKESSFSRRK